MPAAFRVTRCKRSKHSRLSVPAGIEAIGNLVVLKYQAKFVLLAKWLTTGPKVLVLHEPTQAVDVGARRDILHALRRAADGGVAVVLVSSEAEDLAAVCDRILIYSPVTGLREAASMAPDALIGQIYATNESESAGSPA